ncbi:MAG: glycosyltransferase family 9 protein [Bacteroidetes bacterium]|nr:glycosyltransferase family 9 protein [Bacteroidota bacterium]MBS1973186.1 glycosyltransferase family 9 protein [Bacteroidota bacterium]
MKFLIIRFSSIGDIVLTTPVARCLKKQIATAEVHYLTKAAYKDILAANPYIDKTHLLEDSLDAVVEKLKKEDFDYVIDLHHNLRTLRVKRGLKKHAFSFNKLNIEKWLLTALKINRLPAAHIVDRYLQTVESFGVKNDGAGLDYFIPGNELVKESDIPASHHAGYIGIVIGAAYFTKRFPVHKLKALCASLRHPVILLGGPEDKIHGDEVASSDKVKIYNACGKFSLNESADLVRRAKLIISNDTGLMHVAAAFKRPVISLWGNTVPEFGMYPYYGENFARASASGPATNKSLFDMMEIKSLSCRPCSKIGYKKCPKGHFKCMEQIDVNELEQKIYEKINGWQ